MANKPDTWSTAALVGKTIKTAELYDDEPVRVILTFTDDSQALFVIGSNPYMFRGNRAEPFPDVRVRRS